MQKQLQQLLERFPELCEANACLAQYSTWKIGGPAELLFKPDSMEDLQDGLGLLGPEPPLFVVGRGSNILFDDAGFEGLVIQLGRDFNWVRIEGNRLHGGGGLNALAACRAAAEARLGGLEFLSGIPATIGGLVRMNAGAHGVEIVDHLEEVKTVNRSGKLRMRAASGLDLDYRCARKLDTDEIVVSATFKLEEAEPAQIEARMRECQDYRRQTQPLRDASCGSVFKRPANDSPGRLIEAAGLKGYRVGDAQVSDVHANFIVNLGQAKSSDVLELVSHIKRVVLKKSGIELAEEFRHVR